MSVGDFLRKARHSDLPLLRLIPLLAVLALLALNGPTAAAEPAPETDAVPGEVVVQLRDDTSQLDTKRLAAHADAAVARVPVPGFVTLAVKPGDETELIARLSADPSVESAEVNAIRTPQAIPIDDLYPRQWDMPMIQAPQAWATTRGDGVIIAVLDTGVAYEDYGAFRRSHQLMKADFVFPYDATDGSIHANDRDGHGTHVTGTLVQDWDVIGVAGIVPFASIMPIRVCSITGCPSDALANGVHWAVDHGADILNISLSGPSPSLIERDAFIYAEEHGVVAIGAAGNGGGDLIGDPDLPFPARYATVVSVGAVHRLGERADYSNYGEHEGGGGTHVMAPGGNTHEDRDNNGFDDGILQDTYVHRCRPEEPIDYKKFDICSLYGTSMATPHATGVAALLLSEYPDLTPAQVRKVLACSAKDIGPEGDDLQNGSGLVQAANALSDWDENGVVDCLDDPPTLTVRVDDARVLPGGSVRISLDASIPYPGLMSYEVALTYEPAVADMTLCTPRKEALCEKVGNRIFVSSEPSKPVWGNFRLANIDMLAAGNVGAFTSIQIQVQAASARLPDIGLNIIRDDGSLRVSDPVSKVYGDLDCNNKVDAADVVVALRGNPWPCTLLGDANCDGVVDAQDAIALIAFLGHVARPQSTDCPEIGYSPSTPTPTPSPEPSPTDTPTPSPEFSPTDTPTPTATPEP